MWIGSLPLSNKLALVVLHCIASSAWLRACSNLKPGTSRFVAALPVILCNVTLPVLFDPRTHIVTTAVMAFVLVWLSNFKVLAWCINRGPFAHKLPLAQMVAIQGLPITPLQGVSCQRTVRMQALGENVV